CRLRMLDPPALAAEHFWVWHRRSSARWPAGRRLPPRSSTQKEHMLTGLRSLKSCLSRRCWHLRSSRRLFCRARRCG
ncbi:hypothetical protein H4S00_007044, partial [Coemansia sp. D1744]